MSKVKNVQPFHELDLQGSYLVLVNPERIPHLIYVEKGCYYSLTYKESKIGLDFKPFLRQLRMLNKKVLFIEIDIEASNAKDSFSNYQQANTVDTTCFVPIKEIVLPQSEAEMIFELIPELYQNQIIKNAFHFNLEKDLDENLDFQLSIYDKEMIFSYIKALKSKNASR